MISIFVFSDEKAWSKRLKKKEEFFYKICQAFPKKYKFLNKKISFSLLLSNNKKIKKLNENFRNKKNLQMYYHFLLKKNLKFQKGLILGILS